MNPVDSHDIYWDGRHYDLKYRDLKEDIPFWLDQAERYGEPVLELGCGTGRITIPLAEKGMAITGLDISGPMLSLARTKAEERSVEVDWLKGDIRGFHLNRTFNLVILPFSTIAHLHKMEDIEAFLSCVKEHLAPKGRFILDYFNPRLDFLIRDPDERRKITEYPDPDGRGTVVITESSIYDPASQINSIKWYYKIGSENEVVKNLDMRIFFPRELDAILRYNGFIIEEKYGNYDKTPFSSDSPNQIVVCRVEG
ncbi:MAG: class I SAM-dependent methyltransferase [Thermoplasmata archaeon]|nr:MAG: class I SAM-dependent methyltransferase [Thermoplasmata archaeon]